MFANKVPFVGSPHYYPGRMVKRLKSWFSKMTLVVQPFMVSSICWTCYQVAHANAWGWVSVHYFCRPQICFGNLSVLFLRPQRKTNKILQTKTPARYGSCQIGCFNVLVEGLWIWTRFSIGGVLCNYIMDLEKERKTTTVASKHYDVVWSLKRLLKQEHRVKADGVGSFLTLLLRRCLCMKTVLPLRCGFKRSSF